jgi:hypothetical protein
MMSISHLQQSRRLTTSCAALALALLVLALHSCGAEAKTLYVYVDIEGTLRSTVFDRADGTLDFINSSALLYPHAPNRSAEGLPAGRRQVPAVRNWLGQPPLALPFVAYEGARLADLPRDAEGAAVVPRAEEAKQPFAGYVSSVTNPQLTALSAPRLNALRQRIAQRRGLADLRASGGVTDADYMLQWQMNSECPPAPEQPDLVASQQPCDPTAHYVDGMLAVSFSKVDGRIRREAMLQQPFYYALRERERSGSYLNYTNSEASPGLLSTETGLGTCLRSGFNPAIVCRFSPDYSTILQNTGWFSIDHFADENRTLISIYPNRTLQADSSKWSPNDWDYRSLATPWSPLEIRNRPVEMTTSVAETVYNWTSDQEFLTIHSSPHDYIELQDVWGSGVRTSVRKDVYTAKQVSGSISSAETIFTTNTSHVVAAGGSWVHYVPEMQRYVWVGDDYGIYAFDMDAEQGRRIAHFHHNASAPGASTETLAYTYDEPEKLYFFNPHVSPPSDVRMPSEAAAQQAQQRTGYMYLGVYVGSERALDGQEGEGDEKATCRVHIVRVAYNLDGATDAELAEPQPVVVAHAGLHCYNTEDQEAQSGFPYAVAGFHFRMLELDEAAEDDLGDTSAPPDYDHDHDSTAPGPSAAPGSPAGPGEPGGANAPGGAAAALQPAAMTLLAVVALALCATM